MKLSIRFRSLASAALVGLSIVACGSTSNESPSESESNEQGAAAIHPGWFKTPEAIASTMTHTWQLELTEEEDLKYLGGLRAVLGGVSVAQHGSLVERPNELFALATHSLSVFAAEKLIAKQVAKSAAGELYLFDGLGLAADDDGCYSDDSKEWCDGKDGILIGDLTARQVDPNALTKEQRKRLMHKMQAIGEFFLMAIDERTMMPGRAGASAQHAPAFLLDEVFLPKLREAPMTIEQERFAWQEVVTTILMGGYYLDLPAEP